MRWLLISGLCAMGLVWQAGRADACSCGKRKTARESFAAADAVFVGRVISVKTPDLKKLRKERKDPLDSHRNREDYAKKVTLEVTQLFKGPGQPRLVVHTNIHAVGCGYGFREGRSYLVYAHGTSLWTGRCGRTAPADERRKEEIELLARLGAAYRRKHPQRAGKRPAPADDHAKREESPADAAAAPADAGKPTPRPDAGTQAPAKRQQVAASPTRDAAAAKPPPARTEKSAKQGSCGCRTTSSAGGLAFALLVFALAVGGRRRRSR